MTLAQPAWGIPPQQNFSTVSVDGLRAPSTTLPQPVRPQQNISTVSVDFPSGSSIRLPQQNVSNNGQPSSGSFAGLLPSRGVLSQQTVSPTVSVEGLSGSSLRVPQQSVGSSLSSTNINLPQAEQAPLRSPRHQLQMNQYIGAVQSQMQMQSTQLAGQAAQVPASSGSGSFRFSAYGVQGSAQFSTVPGSTQGSTSFSVNPVRRRDPIPVVLPTVPAQSPGSGAASRGSFGRM